MECFPKKHNHKALYKGTLTYGIITHFLLVSNNPQAQFHFNPQSIDLKQSGYQPRVEMKISDQKFMLGFRLHHFYETDFSKEDLIPKR